jgi:glycerol-3-phosphate dehydrogenase subunit C
MTGPAFERLRKEVHDDDFMLDYCSNCKNCDMSCPSGVPISTLNMLARAEFYKTHNHSSQADDMLAHGEKMGKLVTSLPLGSVFANMGMSIGKGIGMLSAMGIASNAPLPTYASQSFYSQFKKIRQPKCDKKVVFYPGCFTNYNQPEVGIDLVKVMNANNIEVIVEPDFVCCGSPLVVGGYLDEAKQNAEKNTSLLRKWIEQGYDIITVCTSCGLMLKQEYQELFHFADGDKIAAKIYDAIEYLEILHDEGKLNTNFKPVNEKFIYHSPCHLRAQGMGLPSLEVLPLIPGLKIENADAGCCGVSGSYGFKAKNREISEKIGAKLFDRVKKSGASACITECGTCRLQIAGGSGVATKHPLAILSQAYGN